jgi:hypothetical protein
MGFLVAFFFTLALNALWLFEVADFKSSVRRSLREFWESVGSPDSFSMVDGIAFTMVLYGKDLLLQAARVGMAGRVWFVRSAGLVLLVWNVGLLWLGWESMRD